MDVCVICTDGFNTIDSIITKCNHKFHFVCLNKWLLIKPQCPYCREDIYDLIDPRTNEKIVYLGEQDKYDEQDEYDENYEQGEQYIIMPINMPNIMPNISIIFLVSNYIFLILLHILVLSWIRLFIYLLLQFILYY